MKAKEIKVGEAYAIGKGRWARRAEVLEVGEIERPARGIGWSRRVVMEKVKGARIRYDGGTEEVVLPAQVARPWADHAAEQAAERERKDAKSRQLREREAAFKDATGIMVRLGDDNSARLTGHDLQALIDLIAGLRKTTP